METTARTLVIGDVHGALLALKQVLQRAAVNAADTLIFLGDFVDGWSQSPQVLDFLMDLSHTNSCIFVRGNHDELLLQWLETSQDNTQWYRFGGLATVQAYQAVGRETKQRHIAFLKSLRNY